MINKSKKFIFIHPPKCAGTSIRLALRDHYKSYHKNRELEPFGIDLSSEGINYRVSVHSTLSKFIEFINDRHGINFFNKKDWYIFTVIRNPFDRIVSFYHHCATHRNLLLTFNDWVCMNLEKEVFTLDKTYKKMFHHNNELCIDHFIRQENIEHDAKIVFNKLGITDYNFYHEKHNTNRTEYDYRKYYNKKTKQIVSKLFEWDINYFGYKF